MTYYSQKDARWATEKLGTCSDTIAKSGCKITCLASFCGKTPSEVNKIIPYVSGCLTNDETAAKALWLPFDGKSTVKPNFDCIAETDHYKSKSVPQHFFILLSDGRCVDPLDLNPTPKKNPYHIVSYRLFKPLITEEPMQKEFVESVEKLLGEEYGDNLNDSEQKDAAGKLKEVKAKLDWGNQLELTNVRLLANNESLTVRNGELSVALMSANTTLEEKEKVLKEYIAQAGTCEPALATCKENLRVQTEKAKEGMEVYGALELLVTAFKKIFNK